MRKSLLVLVLLVFVIATHAQAQPVVYVSNLSGQQILAVDGTSGTTTIVLSGANFNSATFTPEDLVVGPDGKLYICDVGVSPAIWRFDPAAPVVVGTNPLKIVDFTTILPAGVGPVGPTFSGSDDLYVNSNGSGSGAGVWAVPGVAATGPPYSAVQVFTATATGSGGAGTTVEAIGHLLIVDRAGNRVLSANATPGAFPNFITAPTVLISNVPAPVGITTNTCGDVLVAAGTRLGRYTVVKDFSTGNLTAQAQNPFVDFGAKNIVQYVERDASNNLYVATNSSTGGGIIWKVTPGPGDPIAACSAGTAQQLVSFKKLTTGNSPLLTSAQMQAIGVAIPPTKYSATATFSPSQPSATFNFGPYQLTLTFTQVLTTFKQTMTAVMTRPRDVTFSSTAFASNTVGMRFPSLGGFVIQFQTPSQGNCTSFAACGVPVANVDYASPSGGFAFQLVVLFHDPIRGFRNPGVAHSPSDTLTGVYTDDVTNDFWILLDQGGSGRGTSFCKYVLFDQPFQLAAGITPPLSVQLNQPALSNNPLFNLGQNFTVSILVTDKNGVAVPGLRLRVSAARIDTQPFLLQTVQATNNTTEKNFLNDNGNGKYSIGIDTGLFTGGAGTYQFTIFGQGFPPVLPATPLPFNAVFQK